MLISQNGACTFEGDTIDHSGWVNGYVKPLHYLFKKEGKWILIDQGEAEAVLKHRECETLWLINQGMLISKEGLSNQSFREDKRFCQIELMAKLLNGDLLFDELQWNLFASWVKDLGEEKKEILKKFFEEVLFDLHPLLESSPEYHRASKLF